MKNCSPAYVAPDKYSCPFQICRVKNEGEPRKTKGRGGKTENKDPTHACLVFKPNLTVYENLK